MNVPDASIAPEAAAPEFAELPSAVSVRAARDGSVVARLGVAPAVWVSGPDARRFANGMFTNNVRDLRVGGSQRSAMTDDRGRLLGLLDVHAVADDRFLVLVDGPSPDAFIERYAKYVVFDDVELAVAAGLTWWTVQGAAAAGRVEGPVDGHHFDGHTLVARRDRGGRGWDVLAPSDAPPFDADAGGEAIVDALRVLAGQVRFAEVIPPGLPHEHGLREAALHFAKGCYLGQEAIHRLEVQGRPRRALVGVVCAGPFLDPVVRADGVDVGRVVARAPAIDDPRDGAVFGLAVVRRPHDEAGTALTVGDRPATCVGPCGT